MNALTLLNLLGNARPNVSEEKAHAALFLAQLSAPEPLYDFSLRRGRVRSDELEKDIEILFLVGLARVPDAAQTARTGDWQGSNIADTLRPRFSQLLAEDKEVIDAAATEAFFVREGLGDPETKLSWFRALPEPVRMRAREVQRQAAGRA